jgi:hypothetical protein
VTYSADVRSFFFLGRQKVEKVRDSQNAEIPVELGFPKVRYPARNGKAHNSSDEHRRLRKIPKIGAITRKRYHEVHPVTVPLRKKESKREFNRMQVFTAGTTRKTETGIYHLPQKNLTSLGEGKRTKGESRTDRCVRSRIFDARKRNRDRLGK